MDATQDLFIRGIAPPLTAALVGAGAVTACLLILAPAGRRARRSACWPPGSRSRGWPSPASRRAARRTAPARGELGAALTDLLAGAADLHAFGAQDAALAAVAAADRRADRGWPGARPPRPAWAAG